MTQIANYNISLKCFLKNSCWEVLILKTPENSSFLWTYDFPWWRIDESEYHTPYFDILKREIDEEIGIKNVIIHNKVVAIWRHCVEAKFRKTSQEDNFIFYIFFEWYIDEQSTIQLSNEHSQFQWIKLEEIILEDYFISGYLEAAKMYLTNK